MRVLAGIEANEALVVGTGAIEHGPQDRVHGPAIDAAVVACFRAIMGQAEALLDLQLLERAIERSRRRHPAVVREALKVLALPELLGLCRGLLRERLPLPPLATLLEVVAPEPRLRLVSERSRWGELLREQLAGLWLRDLVAAHARLGPLRWVRPQPEAEAELLARARDGEGGLRLALGPGERAAWLTGAARGLAGVAAGGDDAGGAGRVRGAGATQRAAHLGGEHGGAGRGRPAGARRARGSAGALVPAGLSTRSSGRGAGGLVPAGLSTAFRGAGVRAATRRGVAGSGCPWQRAAAMGGKSTVYWDYIKIEEILALQAGIAESDAELSNDEVMFITVHQIDELWFKLAIRELVHVRDLFAREKVASSRWPTRSAASVGPRCSSRWSPATSR